VSGYARRAPCHGRRRGTSAPLLLLVKRMLPRLEAGLAPQKEEWLHAFSGGGMARGYRLVVEFECWQSTVASPRYEMVPARATRDPLAEMRCGGRSESRSLGMERSANPAKCRTRLRAAKGVWRGMRRAVVKAAR